MFVIVAARRGFAMSKALVDLAHLARYTGGDEELNAEVLRLFEEQASELVARLQTVLAARDAKSWKHVTHTLKGAARGIGAFELADACAFAEPIDPADETNALPALSAIARNAEDVQGFIRLYLAR
jgi:HPt (histidine-containing phosphotransfer) domain-containing protein